MNKTMTFKDDLKYGQSTEILICKFLVKEELWKLERAVGKQKEWDIKTTTISGLEQTFEIKRDNKALQTGNICFEFRCFGKPSGVFASKADYIIYEIGGNLYWNDRATLLSNLMMVDKEVKKGGDYDASEMYIVSTNDMHKLFKTLRI